MNGFPRRGNHAFAWGVTLGVAAALYFAWRLTRPAAAVDLDPETVRTIAAGALLADPELRRYDLQVRAIAPGILDVSGIVDSQAQADRALETIRRARGTRTVLNRIEVRPARVTDLAQAES